MSAMLTLAGYAAARGKSTRTVLRWLGDGLVPGAVKVDGQWSIPADAVPVEATSRDVVAPAPVTSGDVTSPLGALGTLEQAAAILGTTVGGVRRLADDGHLVVGRYGPRGSLRVYVAAR